MTQTLASGSGTDNDPERSRRIVTALISILRKANFGNPTIPQATFYSLWRIPTLRGFGRFTPVHEKCYGREPQSEKAGV